MQQELVREPTTQDKFGTFRQFRKQAGSFGNYQRRLFLLMGCHWLTASFFLILPFYFFKRPVYCQEKQHQKGGICTPCINDCADALCQRGDININDFISNEETLTYQFALHCGYETWRIIYKIGPEALSWIGLLIYGKIADEKGRKVAFKISWRFYTIGLVFFTATQTQFLMSFGYFIACANCFPSLVIQFVLLFEQIDRSLRLKACYLLLSFLLVAPLIASILASYLVIINMKICLLVLCTGPAILLSFASRFLEESAIYTYKDNKLMAFNIINNIAKINKKLPITIDLSRSQWLQYTHYHVNLFDVFRHKATQRKLLASFLLMFTFFFNNRLAQISLDEFTNQYLRGTIMNSTSAVATVTVIILITRFKVNKYTSLALLSLSVTLADLIVTLMGARVFILESILCIALRYFSDLSYSIFLIWTIEAFPTVCRTQCLTLALCGSSLGSIMAYSLQSFQTAELIISLILNLAALNLSRPLKLNYENKLTDTLADEYYDEKDRFRRAE